MKTTTLKLRVWQFVHNVIAHPVEGIVVLFTRHCPTWVDRFHEWTARKAWPKSPWG